MMLINHIDEIKKPFPKAVITIGNFDGVHIGHQALFHTVIEKADEIGGTSMGMTFEPHPVRLLTQNGPPLITLYEQKLELIANTGIDVLICQPFTREFAGISAEDFIKKILVERIGMRAIVVGPDYTFGRNREGDLNLLKRFSQDLGFEVVVPGWIQTPDVEKDRISSTHIRELVMEGEMGAAQKMLGRNYQIRGTVARGRNRGGALLGFPTANIQLYDELCPKTGVYAVTVECVGQALKGVANIGYSPTFDDHIFTVEVFIFDFNQNIYGEKIRVNFVQRIRDEIKFDGIDALATQIRKDVEAARYLLKG
jgi:riboflavin kinase / FMN adenylyltransferase